MSYRVILFDLGGVLLRLRDPVLTFGPQLEDSDFLHDWIMSPAVRALESGAIDAHEFARRIVAELGLTLHWQELLRRFDQWPEKIFPEAIEIVDRIPMQYDCAILSNTNPIHWNQIDVHRSFGGRIDRCFLSFESGLLKPDRESFLQVTQSYECRPREILFFDDNPVNVEAAATIGISALLADGPADLEAGLIDAGVL